MSEQVKVYVVEDKAITRETVILSLKKSGFEVVGSSDEAVGALREMQSMEVDIAILDINLRGKEDGIWLAGELNKSVHIPFIFLTAFGDEETLKEVVKTNPHGYLMKPFNSANIYTSIHIALRNFSDEKAAELAPQPAQEPDGNIRIKDSIFVKDRDAMVRLKLKDIAYVMSEDKYLEIHMGSKKHVVRSKLLDFLDHLPGDDFIQVHQRYLINVDLVTSYRTGYVTVNDVDIPVSRSFSDAVSKRVISL